MPQLVKKRRSGWAVLAAGALVASLLAVGSGPAGAEVDVADNPAETSACVGDALDDHMFTDVSDGHSFRDHINCIAYYGITRGTGDGSTFSPNDNVTRAQMAVFIARAAEAAGVDLGDAMDEGFTDIDGTWAEARDAINRLASKGVIDGPHPDDAGAFRPGDDITRSEMAGFLIGLLAKGSPAVTIDAAGAIQLGIGTTTTADDYFGDVRRKSTRLVDAQTAALWELGVTTGATAVPGAVEGELPLDDDYDPDGTVNRGQMTAFITRALAHTSVRPEGVTVQHDGTNLVVSVRDENFAPRANVVVDVFQISTAELEWAFAGDGTCNEVRPVEGGGSVKCQIDGGDLLTRGNGNAMLLFAPEAPTTVWVWTGASDDTFGEDTERFRVEVEPAPVPPSEATLARVSTEFMDKKAHLDETVEYTVQLEDEDGPVSVGDGGEPAQFSVVLSTYPIFDDGDPTTPLEVGDSPSAVSTLPLTTDDDGKAAFPVSVSALPDPEPEVKADKYSVKIVISAGAHAPEGLYIGEMETAVSGNFRVKVKESLVFSTEASSRANDDVTITVEPAEKYVIASGSSVSNRVTVTVTDQYGDPIPGAQVDLKSDADDVTIAGGKQRAAGPDGSFTFGYARTVDTASAELLTAGWYKDGNDGSAPDLTAKTTIEWAESAAGTEEASGAEIQAFDTDDNTIFAGASSALKFVTYDDNDRFNISTDGTSAPSTYADFEAALAEGLSLQWGTLDARARIINVFTLVASS